MIRTVLILVVTLAFAIDLFPQHPNVVIGTLREPNEPSIYINPKNPDFMMAGANLDNYYFSDDAGLSWSESRISSSTLGVWGDPCIVADTLGNFYFFHLSNPPGPAWIDQIVCQKTTDNGISWNQGSGIGLNGSKAQDKEWAVVDEKTNNIYITWTQFDEYGSSNPADSSVILFSSSVNQGDSWSVPVRINKTAGDCIDSDNTVEGAVPAIGPEGEIYVSWAGPLGLMFDRSLDGGLTWLENDIFVSEIPGGWDYAIPGISRANGLPVTCCDLSNGEHRGTIYINWSDQRNGSDDTDIWLVKSTDGGDTWSDPVRVNNDPPGKQQFFSWMTVDQFTGKLWLVFYDRRNYSDVMTDVYMAVSSNGGESFTNFKISESPFFPTEGVFFGDYTNISATNNIVRPIWTRLHNNNLSILTAIVDPLIVNTTGSILQPFNGTKVYPNPFAGDIAFSFKLNEEAIVDIDLYNSVGQKVSSIIENRLLTPGKYRENLVAKVLNLKPGIYYIGFSAGNKRSNHKIVYAP